MNDIFIQLAGSLAAAVGAISAAWLLARVRAGRLARTLDQVTKIIEFVERWSAGYEALSKLSEAKRHEIELLMFDAIEAVRKDFAAEQLVLAEFSQTPSAVRRALLLHIPNRTVMWLPHILFYTLLLFMLYVLFVNALRKELGMDDIVALLIAAACAAFVRLVVHLIPAQT
jgi:hypothetical protein